MIFGTGRLFGIFISMWMHFNENMSMMCSI